MQRGICLYVAHASVGVLAACTVTVQHIAVTTIMGELCDPQGMCETRDAGIPEAAAPEAHLYSRNQKDFSHL